jgi:hypothetical protein
MILALALIMTLLAPCAMAKGSYLGYLKVVNCQSYVTLRAKASTKADAVAKVPLGSTVEAYSYNGQFYECYYLGLHGYILSEYLSGSGSSDYLGTRYVVNCQSYVTLRRYASTSAPEVTRVPKGAAVDAYYYDGTFCHCYYNGKEGYILSKYLGKSSSSSGTYLGKKTIVNCESWVTLRSKPSTSASTVTRVPWGETVEAYSYNSQFAECTYKGLHGYILLKYLG